MLLSKSGAILRPSDNECEIAVEDVDACHLELQVCDSESAHAAELGRAWLPLRRHTQGIRMVTGDGSVEVPRLVNSAPPSERIAVIFDGEKRRAAYQTYLKVKGRGA